MLNMIKLVVLIGTSHEYQGWHGGNELNPSAHLKTLLLRLCAQYRTAAIAEEMTVEALGENGVLKSVAQVVADELGIAHQFSDPPQSMRQKLGVRQENAIRAFGFFQNRTEAQIQSDLRESHAVREQYWLGQLRSLDLWPVVFICGAEHTEPFARLLRAEGLEVIIAFPDWKPGVMSDYR